jgi:hypothetical protein
MTRALDHMEWFDLLDNSKNDLPIITTLLSNLHGYDARNYTKPDLQADVTQLVHLILAIRQHHLKVLRRNKEGLS